MSETLHRPRVVDGSGAFKSAKGTSVTWLARSRGPGASVKRYVLVLR
jgi:hypothetical protein